MATALDTTTTEARPRAAHQRTQVLGLLLLAAAPAVMLVAGAISGLPLGDVSFLFPVIGVLALLAWLAGRFGTWSTVTGLVGTLLAAMMMFWMAFGLFEPAAWLEFTTGVAFVVGFLASLVGGIVALVKRNVRHTDATPAERVTRRAALGLVVVAFLVSMPLYLVQRGSVSEAEAAGAATVEIHNFEFSAGVSVDADGAVVVRNRDPFLHTFTIDGTTIDTTVLSNSSELVSVEGLAPGTYTFYCRPHSDLSDGLDEDHDMIGTITVS